MQKTAALLIFSCFVILTLNAQSEKEKYVDIVKRAATAYMEADLNAIKELYHKEYKSYMFGTYEMGYDGLINRIKEKKGSADKIEFHEIVVEGNKVAHTWTFYTKDAVFKGMKLQYIKDDKIIEEWAYYKMVNE